MRVLVIVDVQNDFCPGGALAVPEGAQVVPIVNQLMRSGAFDLVVATRDWHPAGHVSFAASHEGAELYSERTVNGVPQKMWPTHCVQGTKGAELHEDLDTSRISHIVDKGINNGIDSYSAFFDNARASQTPLAGIIAEAATAAGVPLQDVSVSVCGLALDYCVAWSAIDAKELGFSTEVIVDATRAVNLSPGDDLKTLRDLRERGIDVCESREYLPVLPREVAVERADGRVVELGR